MYGSLKEQLHEDITTHFAKVERENARNSEDLCQATWQSAFEGVEARLRNVRTAACRLLEF